MLRSTDAPTTPATHNAVNQLAGNTAKNTISVTASARSNPKPGKLASACRSDSICLSCQSSQTLTTHAPDSTLSTPPRGCLRSVEEPGNTALTRSGADCKQSLFGWFGDLPSCCS